jgi:hypothetical protein
MYTVLPYIMKQINWNISRYVLKEIGWEAWAGLMSLKTGKSSWLL